MAHEKVTTPSGVTVMVCIRGARGRKPSCSVQGCRTEHTKLCDYPLAGAKLGKTCDRKLCDVHAAKQGPDTDFCPVHERIRAMEAERVAGDLFLHPAGRCVCGGCGECAWCRKTAETER